MKKNEKKKYTYELDQVSAYKLNSIVEVMKQKNETNENGKMYSKNTAVAEAIDYYYNTVVNNNPSFFTRICSSVTTSLVNKHMKCFVDAMNQILINDARHQAYHEAIIKKLDIDPDEVESLAEQIIYDSIYSGDD